jgi:aspartyl-tRNA(Asn)/glutamyl-tRNA(Gln) amidotransferase subunit A
MVTTIADLAYISAAEASELFRSRELSPVDLTLSYLDRIEKLQPSLRAYLTVTPEIALSEARAAEAALLRGDDRPLLGVPIAYKDLYMTAGVRTTAGSRVHEHWVPDVTATTVQKLHDAGMVMLGKLQTHEFAFGLTPEDHVFPPAKNPWNTNHIPGGSSSGSGAALAAGLTVGALGTDTGGSIRGPGSFCGIAALKPTYGRCSRYGVITLAWSLDHAGPMTRTVEDAALMLNAMAGYDPKDPASAKAPVEDYTAGLKSGVRGLRVGVLRSWFTPLADPGVAAAVNDAAKLLEGLGAEIVEVDVPHIDLAVVNSIILLSEAYSYHAKDLAETPELYAAQLKDRMLSGALFFASEYVNAQRARMLLKQELAEALKGVDVLISPTSPKTAPTFEGAYGEAMRRGLSFTGLYNLTGLPAMSIPCGFDDEGLPIGLQIAGRPFDEATVLKVAHAYERSAGWYTRHPAI